MAERSLVELPPGVAPPFEVYLNGVRQEPGRDFRVEGPALVFQRGLEREAAGLGAGRECSSASSAATGATTRWT